MDRKITIIAEAGTSHQGDISAAERLIAAAKETGADTIKFQYVIADEIVHPLSGTIPLPGGPVSIYSRFKELECPPDFYGKLIDLCARYETGFLCSAFGLESARRLRELGVKELKIASPELNHIPLLREIASYPDTSAIISGGVARLEDLRQTLAIVRNTSAVLHCVTAYPAPEKDYNLNVLPVLNKTLKLPTGVSDHSLHPYLVPVLAAAKGAAVIEKHFTLSNRGSGLDDPIALDPAAFSQMVQKVRESEQEIPESVIIEYKNQFGSEKVSAILGSGIKDLAESEKDSYYTTRRSVLAIRDIAAGEKAGYGNCGIYRSEKNLAPGMDPGLFESFIDKIIRKDIPAGGPVLESCF